MMIEPSISDLMKKFESRYTLVIAVAKRAREISAADIQEDQTVRPVSEAINDVAKGIVKIIKAPEEQELPDNITYIDYVEAPEEDVQQFERL